MPKFIVKLILEVSEGDLEAKQELPPFWEYCSNCSSEVEMNSTHAVCPHCQSELIGCAICTKENCGKCSDKGSGLRIDIENFVCYHIMRIRDSFKKLEIDEIETTI
ncbi:MAG: hypothetical protein LRY50_13890 [Geovibrio sp.]|nr:hypothetical protein [Geovibrio sp.]